MRRTNLVRVLSALTAAVIMTAAGAASEARAAMAGTAVMPDGSVRFDYGRRPAPVLVCRPQFVCDIALDNGENVLNMAIGDAGRWIIAGGKSGPGGATPHVFVKPTQPDLVTNLLITTTKRIYDVTLRSSNDAPHSRITFFYADDDAALKAAAADHERLAIESVLAGTPVSSADRADAKYQTTGDSALLPEKVFNDGVRTYIAWKILPADLPAVVRPAKDGVSAPVNFRVVGSMYIIDGTDSGYDLVVGSLNDRHGRRVSIRHQ
jgi:type IV secretion system protein VirB9